MNIKIGAQVQGLVRGLKTAQKESQKTGVSVKKMAGAMIAAGAGLQALNTAGRAMGATFRAAFKILDESTFEMAKFGDRMAKQARMVGVTAEEYQGYEFAAQRAGTSVKAVSNGLKKLGRVMTDAQQGSRQLEETFAALGIEIAESDGKLRPVNDVFLELADKAEVLGESAERTGVLMLLLGRSGTEMANLMEGGAAGIEELQGRLAELNAVMSAEMLANSEAFIDAQTDLEIAFRGLRIELGEHLIPEMTHLATVTTDYLMTLQNTEGVEAFAKRLAGAMRDAAKSVVVLSAAIEAYIRITKLALDATGTMADAMSLDFISLARNGKELIKDVKGLPDAFTGMMERTGMLLQALGDDTAAAIELSLAPGMGVIQEWVSMSKEELAAIERERIKSELADRKAQREREARARAAARKRAAEESRLAKEAASRAAKDLMAQLKAESKALEEYVDHLHQVRADLEALFAEDLGRLSTLFEAGIVKESEFLDRSTAEIRRAAEEQYQIRVTKAKENLDITKQTTEDQIVYYERVAQARQMMERDIQLGMAQTNAAILQANVNTAYSYGDMVGQIGNMFASLSQVAMTMYEGGDENAKKQAIALFHVSQALALATATVNTAAGVAGALGNPQLVAAFPANIVAAATIGAAGAAEIATIIGTSIQGIGDAGITSEMLKSAGLNNHSAIVMRNDETLLDPVGTKHITEMLAIQKAQMQNGGGAQTIRTTVELDGRVLGESVDNYLIRQQERGLAYGNRVRQEYV